MNSVVLMGRLTRDPNVRYTAGPESMAVARYSLAVDRRGKDAGADFISCVAFGKRGEFAEKYLSKGMKICVSGHIQTGSYTKSDGSKAYTTDVVVDTHEFAESKKAYSAEEAPPESGDDFIDIPEGYQENLPF